MAGKPLTPTRQRVSATLRAADFPASRREQRRGDMIRTEGYRTEENGAGVVMVYFETADDEDRQMALPSIRRVLVRKGWHVQERPATASLPTCLIVTAKEAER